MTTATTGKGRGFASISRERNRELAASGGKAAHAKGTAHKWTSEEARIAGRKGGRISKPPRKKSIRQTKKHVAVVTE